VGVDQLSDCQPPPIVHSETTHANQTVMNRSDLWLFLAGLVAASVNAAAGGGTLLSFPALIVLGLSPLAANVTSTVGLLPGSFSSLAGYRKELGELRRYLTRTLAPAIVGGFLGAFFARNLGEAFFVEVVPSLLIGGSLLLLVQPLVSHLLQKRASAGPPKALRERGVLIFFANFLISIYGGYFGAGMGVLFLAVMGVLIAQPIGQINALKVFNTTITNLVGAATFVGLELLYPSGALQFRSAAPLALGSIVGGYFGVTIVRRVPGSWLRAFAAADGLAIAIYFIARRNRN